MILCRGLVMILLLLSFSSLNLSAAQVFTETYTYKAGEADSKLTCRTVSLIEVKRLLLEKIGVYLESRTEVRNAQIEKDQIVAFTAGVVKLDLLNEKWDGEHYFLKARIEVDPDDIAKAIENLKSREGGVENILKLEEINNESLEKIRRMQVQMQQLQYDLVKLNQDMSANEGILNAWGQYETAVKLRQGGKPKEALEILNRVITENPTPLVYFERGMANLEEGHLKEGLADLTDALQSEPNMRGALWARGRARIRSGDKSGGRKDIEKAARLGHNNAAKWLKNHPRRK